MIIIIYNFIGNVVLDFHHHFHSFLSSSSCATWFILKIFEYTKYILYPKRAAQMRIPIGLIKKDLTVPYLSWVTCGPASLLEV